MKYLVWSLFSLAIIGGCRKAEKKSLVEIEKEELAKSIRNDSLFLGYYFGMPQKDFFAKCWELNKNGILREGRGNMTAALQLDKGELNYAAQMDFYPTFINNKIAEMPMTFFYKGWAPWNENLHSSKLIIDVKELMEQWYGKGYFISVLPDSSKGLVKVDGNRRITIAIKDEGAVQVTLTDLSVNK